MDEYSWKTCETRQISQTVFTGVHFNKNALNFDAHLAIDRLENKIKISLLKGAAFIFVNSVMWV